LSALADSTTSAGARASAWSESIRPALARSVPVLGPLTLIGVWEFVTRIGWVGPDKLLPFSKMVSAAFSEGGTLLPQLVITLEESAIGFGLSLVIGVALAVAIVSWRPVDKAIYPLLVGSQVVPKVAVAPLLLVWFGFGLTTKVLIAFLVAMFPIVIATTVGLRATPTEKIYLGRTMGASPTAVFFKIRLPGALPELFAGAKVALPFAITGAMVGEFVAPGDGIGRAILIDASQGATTRLFGAIFYISAAALIAFVALVVLERLAIPWHESRRVPSAAG
jgi:NitT/TauT family transport system permease protein